MNEELNNKVDNLFKDGFQNGNNSAPFEEHDWAAMETLLNGGKTGSIFMQRLPVMMSGIAAMLLIWIGWLLFRPQNVQVNKVDKQTKVNLGLRKDTGNYGRLTQQPAVYTKLKANPAGVQTLSAYDDKGPKRKSFFTLSAAAAGHTNTGSPPVNNITRTGDAAQEDTAVNSFKSNSQMAASSSIPPATVADTTPPGIQIAVEPVKKMKAMSGTGFKPTFAISVLASSDVNSVQSFSQNKVGTSAGVTLTVGLSKRFSITTGAFYADKPYMVPFSAYKTSYKFSATPSTVDASCMVLDVPLNVGYQVYNGGKNKLSLGAGLSSYFMLRESYNFNYPGYGTPTSNYTIRNQNRHLFGVANINATYQRRISQKLDLGIQPYLKLPLTQIGYGQVNLKSAGVAVGVMWNLNSHTKP